MPEPVVAGSYTAFVAADAGQARLAMEVNIFDAVKGAKESEGQQARAREAQGSRVED